MHNLSSVYLVNQPLYVSGIFVAIIRKYTVYIYNKWYVLMLLSGLSVGTTHTNCCIYTV